KTRYRGDGTFYQPGLGSCGIVNDEYDLIAALNAPQMKNGANPNNNPTCGKYIKVTGPLGTVRVKIVDTCPPCVKGDVDLSPAAFGRIAEFDDGRVDISWVW
ncbi:RlpA-like double-psi beta-barrel-protein domain-containing protein-containing protein, partial [Pilobolus umbonatus]